MPEAVAAYCHERGFLQARPPLRRGALGVEGCLQGIGFRMQCADGSSCSGMPEEALRLLACTRRRSGRSD